MQTTPRDLSVVLDFDGTIATRDVGDLVCDRFAPAAWRDVDEAWLRGELSLPAAQRRMWGMVRGTKASLQAYARRVTRLRKGLGPFLRRARAAGARRVVASGGFTFYIQPAIKSLPPFDAVFCNRATFDRGRVALHFAPAALACDRCAVCKAIVLERERAAGARRVLFAGDGSSDRCVLGLCSTGFRLHRRDVLAVVAGSALERECCSRRRAHVAFVGFDELTRLL